MNARTTRWLLLLAAGLFLYIYFFERHRTTTLQPRPAAAPLLQQFRPETVTAIEILRTNNIIRLDLTNGAWRLAVPAYPAQRTMVEGLLTAVGALTRRGHVPASDILAQGGLQAFGLEPPVATLVIHRREGAIQMRLGGRAPAGNQFYLQVVGEDGVQAVDDTLLDQLPSTANQWRDPQLFVLRGTPWNRLEIHAGQRSLRVEKDAATGQWRMLRPLPTRADGRMVERLVLELQTARVSSFVTDQPGADLEPYGLQAPEIVFTLGQGTNQVLTLEIGRSPSNDLSQVYARRSSQTNIVLVPRAQIEPLRAPYTTFLERHLAIFAPAAVSRIEVQSGEPFALQRQTNGAWVVQSPAESFDADRELTAGLLRDLAGLEVMEIAKDVVTELDLPSYGLAPPLRSYVLRAASTNASGGITNALLAQVDFGKIETNRIFARRSDETTVYYVNQESMTRLPQTPLALRERQVWSFTTNQVATVSLRSGGQNRKLARNSKNEWSIPGGGPVAPPLALEELLFRLGQLRAIAWTARKPDSLARYGIREGEQEITIEIKAGDLLRPLTLLYGGFSPGRNPYVTTMIGEERFVFEADLMNYAPFLEVLRDLKMPAPMSL